jgi:phosphoserine aminotransferase
MRKMIDKVKSVRSNAIIVADMSASLGSRDLSEENLWDDLGVVYGGAKTNFGFSGLTFTIIREDVLNRVKEIHNIARSNSLIPVPIMMDWVK